MTDPEVSFEGGGVSQETERSKYEEVTVSVSGDGRVIVGVSGDQSRAGKGGWS